MSYATPATRGARDFRRVVTSAARRLNAPPRGCVALFPVRSHRGGSVLVLFAHQSTQNAHLQGRVDGYGGYTTRVFVCSFQPLNDVSTALFLPFHILTLLAAHDNAANQNVRSGSPLSNTSAQLLYFMSFQWRSSRDQMAV